MKATVKTTKYGQTCMLSRTSNCKTFLKLGAIKHTATNLSSVEAGGRPHVLYIWLVAAGFAALFGAVKAAPFLRRQLRSLAARRERRIKPGPNPSGGLGATAP